MSVVIVENAHMVDNMTFD